MTVKSIKIKRKNDINFNIIGENKNIIILTGLFISGIITGAGMIGKSGSVLYTTYRNFFDYFFNYQKSVDILSLIITFLIINSGIYIFSLFVGNSALGIPVIYLLQMLIGTVIGMFSGAIIKRYGLNGMEYYTIIIIPGLIIAVLGHILVFDKSINSSENILKYITKTDSDNYFNLKYLILKDIKYYLILVCSSLISALTTELFINLFGF